MPFQWNMGFGAGPHSSYQSTLNIQPVIPIAINENWNIITRTILPIESWPAPSSDTHVAGIGLHAGEAVSGNIGWQARQQYSISGNVVILASRIEQLNKDWGSQLLVSAEVLREAGEDDNGAESLGLLRVKGRDEPIKIYRLA